MFELNLLITSVAAVMIFSALFSRPLRRDILISEPMVMTLLGIILGPYVTGLIDPSTWPDEFAIVEEAARFTLAISLIATALRIPNSFIKRYWKPISLVLVIIMPLMLVSSGLLIHFLLGISLPASLLIGAIVTPTDPVIATSIITSRRAERSLPGDTRHFISSESGANDGLAFPFVFLPLLFMQKAPSAAILEWFLKIVLWETIGAAALGVGVGYLSGRCLNYGRQNKLVERFYFIGFSVTISVFTLGLARLLGMDAIIAAFTVGLVFSAVVPSDRQEEIQDTQEAVDRFFSLPIFTLFGLLIPWDGWLSLGWPALLLIAGVILLRRLPYVILLRKLFPPIRKARDAVFAGWFGPVGIAALFYASHTYIILRNSTVWNIATLIIFSSIIIHGITAIPFIKLYAKEDARERA